MHQEQWAVELFHRKHGFPVGEPIDSRAPKETWQLASTLLGLSQQALALAQQNTSPEDADLGLVRIHLILEELAELADAVANGNKVAAADALGDLVYVVLGAGVSWDIPLKAVFDEIQQSNMTKAVRDPSDTRLRDKGESYRPPNILQVLALHELRSKMRRPK